MASRCVPCNRSFTSREALLQHKRNAPAHAATFHCGDCNRSFRSQDALDQHRRSTAHAATFACAHCERSFGSQDALDQHRRSSTHTATFTCGDCGRSFGSENALVQHRRSPAHTATVTCKDCDRSFGSEDALDQHLRYSPVHQLRPETPLDTFFSSFSTFEYDPGLPPATSYANLRRHEGWRRNDRASADAWDRYQDALQAELRKWYGAENDITAWHALCRAIGVDPLPQTCARCESV